MGEREQLAADIRAALDGTTPGPWEACTAPHPDDDKTPAEWLASCLTGDGELWCVTAPNMTGDGYGYLVPAVTGDGPFSEAHAEFIASMPELLRRALAVLEPEAPARPEQCPNCLGTGWKTNVPVGFPCSHPWHFGGEQ